MTVLWWNKMEPRGKGIFAKGNMGHGKREVEIGKLNSVHCESLASVALLKIQKR
jgi:hypothetical protein